MVVAGEREAVPDGGSPVPAWLDDGPVKDKPQASSQEDGQAGPPGEGGEEDGGDSCDFLDGQEEDVDLTITLRAVNPQRSKNMVRFDFRKRQFGRVKTRRTEFS